MVVFDIPSFREFKRYRQPWTPVMRSTQDVIPSGEIHEQLGIPKDSRVLFFAGAHGDWANALAKTTNVHYTDLSESMTNYARERFPGINRFSVADAASLPARANRYDYVVSFEPFPMWQKFHIIGLRALAYTKGLRLVNVANNMPMHYMKHQKITEVHMPLEKTNGQPVKIYSIDSTPKLSRDAKIELTIITALQRKRTANLSQLLAQVRRRVKDANEQDIQTTLKRISDYYISRRRHTTPTEINTNT